MARRSGIRVLNVTRNCRVKLSQMQDRIGVTLEWVERGVSFRELSLSEVLQLRAAHSESARSLPTPYRTYANELPGLIFQPPAADRYKFRERMPLLREAAEILEQWA